MDIEKLIERLRHFGSGKGTLPLHNIACKLMLDAATALSTLQAENEKLRTEKVKVIGNDELMDELQAVLAENEKLRAELEQAKQERDAAVKDLNEFLAMSELCPIQCEWCKWKDTFCDGKTPEWRGIKED